MFANAVLPMRQHHRLCNRIRALTSPEKHYLWLINEMEECISALEKEVYGFLVRMRIMLEYYDLAHLS